MNTCGDCPRRPAAAALLAGARKGVCAGPLRWKAPRALEGRRIDVHRRERAHATGPLARRVQRFARTTHSRPREVSEGSTRRGYRKPTKLRCFTPPRAKAHERGSRSARSRHRAVKRGAVGGPDDRKVVRRRPRNRERQERPQSNRRSGSRTSAGFPRRSAAVSEGGVSTWVLVARNVGCRNGFEAS